MVALTAASGSCLERLPAMLPHFFQLMGVLLPKYIHTGGVLPLKLL